MDSTSHNQIFKNIRMCMCDANSALKKRETALNLVRYDKTDEEKCQYIEDVCRNYMFNVNTNNILKLAHLDSIMSDKKTNVNKIKKRMRNDRYNWIVDALELILEEINHDIRDIKLLKDPFEYMNFVDRYLNHHFGFHLEHTLEPSKKRGLYVDNWHIHLDKNELIKKSMSHSIKKRSE